ncbi:single-stranded DNA-binding protein [Corynebacterium striatum]
MGNPFTIHGNVVAQPELKQSNNGRSFATFKIASTSQKKDQQGNWVDEGTLFVRVTVFGLLAENATESLNKGTRVIASGELRNRNWEDKDGNKRDSFEMIANTVGVSLANQTVQVSKPGAPAANDPWGGSSQGGFNGADNQPPF